MSAQLDEQYFTWLYGLVSSVKIKNRSRTYWSLTRQLYQKEFIWIIPNDDNRVEDGRDLRQEFIDACQINDLDHNWLNMGCSMLEMLIGLSRRLSFEADGVPDVWFWHLIETMELRQYSDRNYDDDIRKEIDEVLDRIIWRNYEPNGHGGLFPLTHTMKDQRKVELWYQLCAYLLELELI